MDTASFGTRTASEPLVITNHSKSPQIRTQKIKNVPKHIRGSNCRCTLLSTRYPEVPGLSGEVSREVCLMNRKVLLVDDEPALLECYKQMLERKFDIETAGSGEEGLVTLRAQGPFAAVVSDMQMSGMDGVQFLKQAREITPNTMRVLLSGRLDLKSLVDAINRGWVFRMLLKPCDRSVLTDTV